MKDDFVKVGKAFDAQAEQWRQLAKQIQASVKPIVEQAAKFAEDFKWAAVPAIQNLHKNLAELPSKIRDALVLPGQNGWYIDLDLPLPSMWELREALEEGKYEEVEQVLADHFEARLDEIEMSLIQNFPAREQVMRAAFSAHRRGEFFLAIPVLLAQTDGICKEVVNQHLFIKRDRKPRTAAYVEHIAADTFKAAILSPLAESLPIGASEYERGVGFTELNRHMVLHGESCDYGTRINSLKAISLINYVAHALRISEERP